LCPAVFVVPVAAGVAGGAAGTITVADALCVLAAVVPSAGGITAADADAPALEAVGGPPGLPQEVGSTGTGVVSTPTVPWRVGPLAGGSG
jgi:hypothetical protein